MMITCAQSPARSARFVGFTGSAPQVRTSWSLGYMRRERVKELHYITDVANLASIMRLGILSYELPVGRADPHLIDRPPARRHRVHGACSERRTRRERTRK